MSEDPVYEKSHELLRRSGAVTLAIFVQSHNEIDLHLSYQHSGSGGHYGEEVLGHFRGSVNEAMDAALAKFPDPTKPAPGADGNVVQFGARRKK
jgi:hypothetical protein